MGVEFIRETNPKARKEHACMACDLILEDLTGFSFSELRKIVKAKRNDYKIKPGQSYINQVCVYDGRIYNWKAIPEMHELCIRYELYRI